MSMPIDDIVREMRKDMPRVIDPKVILRNYADRIEEAVAKYKKALSDVVYIVKMFDDIDNVRRRVKMVLENLKEQEGGAR